MFFQGGSIEASTLNIETGRNFTISGYITAADTFNITADSFIS